MTKRDEAVFDKAFEKMEAKGCFVKLQAKAKAKTQAGSKPAAFKVAKKQGRRAASVSSTISGLKVPLAAQKK